MERRARQIPTLYRAALACAALMLAGCATSPNNIDPHEKLNRFFYGINDDLDRMVLKPLSDGYVKVTPRPVRTGRALQRCGSRSVSRTGAR